METDENKEKFIEACMNGDKEYVIRFIEMLKDGEHNDRGFGKEILKKTIEKKYFEIVKLLIENSNILYLNMGISDFNENQYEIIKMIISDDDIDLNNSDIIHECCQYGITEFIDILLKRKNINFDRPIMGLTPFHLACEYGHTEIVTKLLDRDDIDYNKYTFDGYTAFYLACERGNNQIIKLLLEKKYINVNKRYKKPSFNKSCIISEIDASDLNMTVEYGMTPFAIACNNNNISTVKLLLSNPKIDINLKYDCNQGCALNDAFQKGHIDIIRLLLDDKRTRLDAKNNLNEGFLHIVFSKKDIKNRYNDAGSILNIISKMENLDLNAMDIHKRTALSSACDNYFIEGIRCLLAFEELNINLKYGNQDSPFQKCCLYYKTCERYGVYFSPIKMFLNRHDLIMDYPMSEFCKSRPNESLSFIASYHDVKINTSNGYAKGLNSIIEIYNKNKIATRMRMRKCLQLSKYDVALLYCYLLYYGSKFKKDDIMNLLMEVKMKRFYFITRDLPCELLMIICNRVYNMNSRFINGDLIKKIFDNIKNKKLLVLG